MSQTFWSKNKKEGVFDGPQIRTLLNDKVFEEKMTVKEKAAWQSFREVTQISRKYKRSTIQKHC